MPTVLIIDSETSVAESLDEALNAKGVETVVTADGAEGLKIAKSDAPDLVVLCVELSRGSGYSVCNKLKKDSKMSGIPLILTSSQATEETFEQHKKLRTRAEAYLKKPYELQEILDLIGEHVVLGEGGDDEEVEVSLDDLALDDDDEDEGFDVSVDVDVEDEDEDEISVETDDEIEIETDEASSKPEAGFSAQSTSVLVAGAEADRMRTEIRQLRQKVQKLETTLQEKELEFNDRLLTESSRGRDAIDLKKKLGQVEREVGKFKQAAEKAQDEADTARAELTNTKKDAASTEGEREVLSEKIGQLVDKVKSLAAERNQLQEELDETLTAKKSLEAQAASVLKVQAKAKKAVDIAVQLIQETGLTN